MGGFAFHLRLLILDDQLYTTHHIYRTRGGFSSVTALTGLEILRSMEKGREDRKRCFHSPGLHLFNFHFMLWLILIHMMARKTDPERGRRVPL